jgi:hypothetical protein
VQRGEPQMGLGLRAAHGQHDQAPAPRLLEGRGEQRALAHARLADDEQRAPASGNAVERRADLTQLTLPAEQPRRLALVRAHQTLSIGQRGLGHLDTRR